MPSSHTGLSPEWDRRYDAAFAELISHDDDLVRAEFARLARSAWPGPHRTAPTAPPSAGSPAVTPPTPSSPARPRSPVDAAAGPSAPAPAEALPSARQR